MQGGEVTNRIAITATGEYAYKIPPEFLVSLQAEIESHMKAYGVTGVSVSISEPAQQHEEESAFSTLPLGPRKKGRLVTLSEDPVIASWIQGLIEHKPTRPGSFLAMLANCTLRADPENYELLRPALLAIRAKYPKYSSPVESDLMTGNHERDEGSHGR